MLKIGDFSKLSMVSIRMLRHYDEIGLLVPRNTDDFTGYRYYGEDQLTVAGRIAMLKNMGFALATIREIMENYDNPQVLASFLEVKQSEVKTEAEEARRRLQLIETTIKRLRKDETFMNYSVLLKTMPERYVASVRQIIPSYQQEGILWGIMMGETAKLHMQFADPCYSLAMFHDGEYKEANVDVEVQMAVKGSYENTANVVFKTEPAAEIVSVTFKGGYEQTGDVNEAIANWVKDNNDYDFAGKSFFIYHVSPNETKNPDEYVTEVCYPIKKK